jgi:hypothetical protein
MKTADERLRAAARDARGIFPPDGDLPPLRLPDPARANRRAGARASMSRIRRNRAWLAPVAAAAAVAVVIAGVVVLHQSANRAASAASAAAAAGLARQRADARAIKALHSQQQALDALVVEAFVPATGPQYDAGSKLTWMVQARELAATARCMAASGYHISDQPAPFDPGSFADNTQMPDLPRIARTHEFAGAPVITGGSYPKAEQNVFNTCQAKARAPYQGLLAAGETLDNSWWNIISRIQASGPVQAAIPALTTCATRYGFPNDPYGPSSGPITSFSDFMDWVSGFLDGAGSRGASTSTLQALSRHWTTVFVTCARPIVAVWEGLQLTAQTRFLHRNASQVRQLDQLAWQLLGHPSR